MTKTIVAHPNDLLSMVGKQLGPTETMPITQDRINQFADATGDHQWIHIDAEKAASGPFGKTIAHGYLTLSLASCFLPDLLEVHNVSMGVNYGTEKVRFPSPVPVDSEIFASGEIISAEENKGGIKVVVRVTISVVGADRPACIVDTISIFYP
ncbi:MAG: MaoC family dehydratase [Porticoccaceae bacterium]|nr:MaoC family dehydratase [Porticoccaceae bacterium]